MMMQLPQLLLAGLCILLGIVPALGFALLQRALSTSREGLGAQLAETVPTSVNPLRGVVEAGSSALFAPAILAAIVTCMLLAAYGISKLGKAKRRAAAPWFCGYAQESESNRYIADNFYGEIKRYFGWLGGQPPSMTKRDMRETR